jgi:tRNA A-37 threonylcarbamoyl transferase component Bud32
MPASLSVSKSGTQAWRLLGPAGRRISLLIVVFLVVIVVLLWQAWQGQRKLIESAALQQAALYSQALTDMRTLYTSEVVARVGSHGVEVTHNYAETEGAIPLPATLSMMLGARISERGAGGYVRLYSDYPFPWRTDGGPNDDFQVEALIRLRQAPTEPVHKFDEIDGRPVMRYATADTMRESCVRCHNTHPESPKTNWTAGELRGVLEVTIPVDAARAQATESFRGTFILLVTVGGLAFGTLVLMGRDLRRKLRLAWVEKERFGQYTLKEKLGEGGMGAVYRARHALLRRPTAVKILRSHEVSKESAERFEREVQLTSALSHPNTIAIYDYGHTPEGDFYYAMEFVNGISIDRFVKRFGVVGEARVIYLLRQACASLREAHDSGLVHRDVNPRNIMICRRAAEYDVVKVLDFGIVKKVEAEDRSISLTRVDAFPGTPLYMSPEQVLSKEKVGAQSDVYQIGAVGYFLLTGEPLFAAESIEHLFSQHAYSDPRYPSARANRKIARDLEALIMQCVEKQPQERPNGMSTLIERLDSLEVAGEWDEHKARDWWLEHADDVFDATPPSHG